MQPKRGFIIGPPNSATTTLNCSWQESEEPGLFTWRDTR